HRAGLRGGAPHAVGFRRDPDQPGHRGQRSRARRSALSQDSQPRGCARSSSAALRLEIHLAGLKISLARAEERRMRISAREAVFFSELMLRSAGVRLRPADISFLESRLDPVARAAGIESPDELIRRLSGPSLDPTLTDRVIGALTTHDTRFFRNPEVFA